MSEKPETEVIVKEKLASLKTMWDDLESTTQTKAKCLFDANKAELFTQSCADLDKWLGCLDGQLTSDDYGKDLTSVNILLKKQQVRSSVNINVGLRVYHKFEESLSCFTDSLIHYWKKFDVTVSLLLSLNVKLKNKTRTGNNFYSGK